jgi:hypothetical protein
MEENLCFDPEWVGFVLMRLTKWTKLKGAGTDDFQDIDLWRRSAIAGIRLFRLLVSGPVIVPMTFSYYPYFEEVVTGIRRLDSELKVFCLKASLPTVKKRLLGRGVRIEGPGSECIARRIIECAGAHRDSHFGEFVDTEGRSACEVTEDITERLRQTHPIA